MNHGVSRPTLVALGIGAVGFGASLLLGLFGVAVMPSYLGAWLFVLALPLGALPVVMGCELLDVPETLLGVMLRRLVAVMPLAALLAIPVLLRIHGLYPALSAPKDGLPGWWMTPVFFVVRAVVLLLAWTALSFVFSHRPGSGAIDTRRPLLAAGGLGLHFVMGTLAAIDWAQSVEPSFNSSAFGLLLISAWSSIAVSLAVTLAVSGRRPRAVRGLSADPRDPRATQQVSTAIAVLLANWGFLVFTQYLVVWSANLPREVIWYQHRAAGLGLVAEYSAGILCALALLALLPRGFARHAGLLAWVAAALLVMHGFEMLWLVTPAFRSSFTLTLADVLGLAGAAGTGIGAVMMLGEPSANQGRVGHGSA